MTPQRVLIVEDEPSLRSLLDRFVRRAGYQSDVAGSAEEALQLLENPGAGFDCLLVDLTLPALPGDELARQILQRFPESRIVLMSGYPYDPSALGPPERVEFLQKPFLPQRLADALGRLSP